MACGDRYAYMVTNSLGQTAEDPCGSYCNDADHAAWNAAAQTLATTVNDFHAKWLEATGGTDATLAASYVQYTASMVGLVAPSAFRLPGKQAELVSAVLEKMRVGVCLLEQMDDQIVAAGHESPGAPGQPAGGMSSGRWRWFVYGAVGLAVLGGGVFAVVRWRRPAVPNPPPRRALNRARGAKQKRTGSQLQKFRRGAA